MYLLKTSAAFDSAHFLADYHGKCANIHGHHWVIEAQFKGTELQKEGTQKGMLIDFGIIKKIVRNLADDFDHALIYEQNTLKNTTEKALQEENFHLIPVAFRPTAENFAKYFFDCIQEKNLPIYCVAVYETPENCAVYSEEELS